MTKIPNHVIKVLCEAYREMNIIRAREGVPRGSNITQTYWNDIMDRINSIVLQETGKHAWLNPELYKE